MMTGNVPQKYKKICVIHGDPPLIILTKIEQTGLFEPLKKTLRGARLTGNLAKDYPCWGSL